MNCFFKSFIFFPFILFSSCEKKQNQEQSLPLNKTFRHFSSSAVPSMDWNKATDTTSSMVIDNIMEGLVAYDFSKKDISYRPALAQSIQSQNQGQKWIFTLRKNVHWTDGVPFSGQQVIDGWERLLNPKTASEYAYFLFNIKNAKQYNNGKIKDFSKVGVRLTPEGKIEVELTGPKHFFPFTLTHTTTYPIRKDIIKKHGAKWTNHKNIVTLGPYSLHHWQQDKLIILRKNPSYYGSFPGNAENITIKIIPEVSTALNLFESGKIDFIDILPSKQLPILKKRSDFSTYPRLSIYYYGFQTKKLNNVKLRKAIIMAIDREQITQMLNSEAVPLKGWIPENVFGYNPNIGLSFNPKKAQKLIKEIQSPIPKITLSYNTNEDHKRIAENVQAQLKKNLGLNIELANEEWKVYLKTLMEGNVFIYRMGWVADYPDPDTFMTMMASYSENNHTFWKNVEYDRLIEEASTLPNNEKRKKLYNQAQRILTEEDVPVFPIFFSKNQFLISKRVKHYPHNVMGKFIFKEIILR